MVFFWEIAFPMWAQISPGELSKFHANLEGMVNCTKCHVLGDKVSNEKCLECHQELKSRVNQGKGFHASSAVTGKDCFSCHSEHHGRNFEIVRFDSQQFDHQKTGFRLTGAHIRQECNTCHRNENIESADIKKKTYTYLGLKTNCNACHEDVHQNTLSTDCAKCHTTQEFKPATLFDHSKTDFLLKGKHQETDCRSCHEVTFEGGKEFQRFKGIQHTSCADCHADPHKGSFGSKCTDCHNEQSFTEFMGRSSFNHAQTQFPLLGKHRKIDCTACHEMGAGTQANNVFQDYKGKDVHSCITCHQDVHQSKFGTDCKQCHSEDSFQKMINPEAFKHDLTGYPLEGKHTAVDCRKCHLGKATDPLPHELCGNCHKDYHEGQFIRGNEHPDCNACHQVEGFTESSYTVERHQASSFPLEGAHQATPCFSCHLKNEEWTFTGLSQQCAGCHTNVHEGGLGEKYYPQQKCVECHGTTGWTDIDFNHQQTGFELSGRHQTIRCTECHQPDPKNPPRTIYFTGLIQDCFSCHQDQHGGQFEEEGKTTCSGCHSTTDWKPSTFDHNTAAFKLEGAHSGVACEKCHKPEANGETAIIQYKLDRFECADCHGG
jgi:hypothetical protein